MCFCSQRVADSLDEMLEFGANVNMYVAHGGTSFGLTAGEAASPVRTKLKNFGRDKKISEGLIITEIEGRKFLANCVGCD